MTVTFDHFARAAADIAAHGDNDTLPFDIDTRFVNDKQRELAQVCERFSAELQRDSPHNNGAKISQLNVFSERLLTPAGPSGFRIATKIHPFWNLYFNGLGVAIAEARESRRDPRAKSYRFKLDGGADLFERESSWRRFREDSATEAASIGPDAIVVQTDISSFYEHVSHHYVENCVADTFDDENRVAKQINALLLKFSGGRSFGLPIGSQCSRILAELFLDNVDQRMTSERIRWSRYVDDYVLIAGSHSEAYRSLSFLSHTLADYGLTLSKTKTVFLTAGHYSEYVAGQLGADDDDGAALREIDLYFDPYSDEPIEAYDSLREIVESLPIQRLLNREIEKALPDTFIVNQVGRSLALHKPEAALQLASTLLSPANLHAFRASWSTLMRGLARLRSNEDFSRIHAALDSLLDQIPDHSNHLIQAEASLLHYLRTIRFTSTERRKRFLQDAYTKANSETVRRACIDCWRQWRDRAAFTHVRNRWSQLNPECQRMVWLASSSFGDEGDGFRRQIAASLEHSWRLGIERNQARDSYWWHFSQWCNDAAIPN